MIRRQLSRSATDRDPSARWNAFIDLLATEEFDDLTPTQRQAYLAFWYDCEVQNGGHLQYFENEAGARAGDAVGALRAIGALCQAAVLAAAVQQRSDRERDAPSTAEQYVELARQGEFDHLDAKYGACEPPLTAVLEHYLDAHEAEFLQYVAG